MVHVHWFRRDLRLHDHRGLVAAARSGRPVLPLFIFDRSILEKLSDPADRRVAFIHQKLDEIRCELELAGSALLVRYGTPLEVWEEVLENYPVASATLVRDYEPYARERDHKVWELLKRSGIRLTGVKDQVVFEKDEILTRAGEPYRVYTPYARSWKRMLQGVDLQEGTISNDIFLRQKPLHFPSLGEIGFRLPDFNDVLFPPDKVEDNRIESYDRTRDLPAVEGTTRLSVHLRFGTVSVRQLVARAIRLNEIFLNELIWREFYQMILWYHPESPERSIRPGYDDIEWEDNPVHFEAWCQGRTGYPLVDAGMRQLNRTGFMHNRLRMVTASFLAKHLLIDWRKGERYFAEKLLDFDLASNVGGWQWAAGCGTDAAPYFRIFNPIRQQERFDPERVFIRKFCPELGTSAYPDPIVDHAFARKRALDRYKAALA